MLSVKRLFFVVLVSVLVCSQISFAGYIGDSNTVMRFGKYSISPYSYIVEQFNSTHYQSTNASGYVYQSANASKLFDFAFANVTSGSIHIKAGTYSCDSPLTIPDYVSVTVSGNGFNNTVLTYTGANTSSAFLTVGHVNYTALRDLTFQSNNNTVHVLNWTGANVGYNGATNKPFKNQIRDCCFSRSTSYGVAIYQWYDDCNDKVEFFDNRIVLSYGGLYLACGDNEVRGNKITRCSNNTANPTADIRMAISGTNIITNNYMGGACDYGLYIGSQRNVISSNIIDHHTQHGVVFYWTQGNIFVGNKVSDNGISANNTYFGIYLNGNSQNNTINGNIIYQPADVNNEFLKYGINEEDGNSIYNVITNNLITGFGTLGINMSRNSVCWGNLLETKPMEKFVSGTNTTATTAVIAHGLAGTPDFVFASFDSSTIDGWTWTADASNITVTVTGTLPATWTTYLQAIFKSP